MGCKVLHWTALIESAVCCRAASHMTQEIAHQCRSCFCLCQTLYMGNEKVWRAFRDHKIQGAEQAIWQQGFDSPQAQRSEVTALSAASTFDPPRTPNMNCIAASWALNALYRAKSKSTSSCMKWLLWISSAMPVKTAINENFQICTLRSNSPQNSALLYSIQLWARCLSGILNVLTRHDAIKHDVELACHWLKVLCMLCFAKSKENAKKIWSLSRRRTADPCPNLKFKCQASSSTLKQNFMHTLGEICICVWPGAYVSRSEG